MTKLSGRSQQLAIIGKNHTSYDAYFRLFDSLAIGSEIVLGAQGGAALAQLHSTTGVSLYIDSSSADDAVAGTGAQIVRVWGFDYLGNLMYEDISPVGQTGTLLVNTDWGQVFYMEIIQVGSGLDAAGNIFIQDDASGTNKYLAIAAAAVNSTYCSFYIPEGWIASYEIDAWVTIVTTATDAVTVNLYEVTNETNDITRLVSSIAWGSDTATVGVTRYKHLDGLLKSGVHNVFKGVDIGTSAQTLNFTVTVGLRKI